ncbi:MAG: hypothetical protein HY084_02770 [Gemmatimonadetes bacterium]|nr:hypothetical protein [Gemmatimonadota bacterium]
MSCASDPAFQRATRIADADKSAKIALENENKLDPAKIPARTFAVLPFTVVSNDTLLRPLSFGLADMLMSDLATSPELRLVERLQVNSMLRELALVDSGRVDPHTAPRVGRLVGARRLLIGDAVLAPDGTMQLNARVVDVIGGTVQELVSAQAPLARVIDAEKQLALLVFERLGITLTPAQRTRVEQRQSVQLATLVAYGRGVQAEARGDAAGATAAFEETLRIDPTFAPARTQLAAAPATSSAAQRASSVARVIDLSAQAINAPVINAPVAPKPPEAVDAPLSTGSVLTLIFTIRVNP